MLKLQRHRHAITNNDKENQTCIPHDYEVRGKVLIVQKKYDAGPRTSFLLLLKDPSPLSASTQMETFALIEVPMKRTSPFATYTDTMTPNDTSPLHGQTMTQVTSSLSHGGEYPMQFQTSLFFRSL